MGITACKPGKLLRDRSGTWRVNASLHCGNILYAQQNGLGTISTSCLSNGAISIRSRHMALSMDACKLHTNSLTTGTATLWLTGRIVHSPRVQRRWSSASNKNFPGGRGGRGRRADHLFAFFFYLYFIPELLGTRYTTVERHYDT